jgi:hypothetical protein
VCSDDGFAFQQSFERILLEITSSSLHYYCNLVVQFRIQLKAPRRLLFIRLADKTSGRPADWRYCMPIFSCIESPVFVSDSDMTQLGKELISLKHFDSLYFSCCHSQHALLYIVVFRIDRYVDGWLIDMHIASI